MIQKMTTTIDETKITMLGQVSWRTETFLLHQNFPLLSTGATSLDSSTTINPPDLYRNMPSQPLGKKGGGGD